jgi:Uma2 family endonuclease
MTALTVNLNAVIELTDEQFFQLCQANRDLRFERTPTGELIIMPPVGGETSNRNVGFPCLKPTYGDGRSYCL